MEPNTISVTAHIVTGGEIEILKDAAPSRAIEDYLCPDMRPPVQSISITVCTSEGKQITISVGQKSIGAYYE